MSKVPAHWDAIGEIVALAKSAGSQALILGNGDVASLVEAQQKVDEYGVDGVMLGRALFGNPWLFRGYPDTSSIPVKEKLEAIRRHTQLFQELLADPGLVGFPRMKKFCGNYAIAWLAPRRLKTCTLSSTKLLSTWLPRNKRSKSLLRDTIEGRFSLWYGIFFELRI
jgi:tRNA-dihydrouridine synthase